MGDMKDSYVGMIKTRRFWLLFAAVLLVGFCGWAAVRVRLSDWYVAETKYALLRK